MAALCRSKPAWRVVYCTGRYADNAGGEKTGRAKTLPCWPRLLRAVRAWLTRYWSAFASAPLPAELAALLGTLNAGHGINLYLRI